MRVTAVLLSLLAVATVSLADRECDHKIMAAICSRRMTTALEALCTPEPYLLFGCFASEQIAPNTEEKDYVREVCCGDDDGDCSAEFLREQLCCRSAECSFNCYGNVDRLKGLIPKFTSPYRKLCPVTKEDFF
ncbi:hypothetical protein L596_000415 [Steinernema carpocapsae]|uniref:Domain of unknown function DB domain-containing protein n=1 Tax=Steinernema carpocapsae TaxID=34508 RepID=A0A4U8UIR3_STECR|nr:hypothetical protein L596_000415 [Steinernema carpocapsae]